MGMILGWMFGAIEGAGVIAAIWWLWWDRQKKRLLQPQVQYVYFPYPVQVDHPKHRRMTYDYMPREVIDSNGMPILPRGVRPYRDPMEVSSLWYEA